MHSIRQVNSVLDPNVVGLISKIDVGHIKV